MRDDFAREVAAGGGNSCGARDRTRTTRNAAPGRTTITDAATARRVPPASAIATPQTAVAAAAADNHVARRRRRSRRRGDAMFRASTSMRTAEAAIVARAAWVVPVGAPTVRATTRLRKTFETAFSTPSNRSANIPRRTMAMMPPKMMVPKKPAFGVSGGIPCDEPPVIGIVAGRPQAPASQAG